MSGNPGVSASLAVELPVLMRLAEESQFVQLGLMPSKLSGSAGKGFHRKNVGGQATPVIKLKFAENI